MSDSFSENSLLEIFIDETLDSLQQLEDSMLAGEQQESLQSQDIHLIFRIMHTIKGSAAELSSYLQYLKSLTVQPMQVDIHILLSFPAYINR